MTPITRVVLRLAPVFALAALLSALPAGAASGSFTELELGGERFRLELAVDDAQRARGLMFRESIPANGGMLFVFADEIQRSFWMANCLVDMDILFVDSEGVVVSVLEMFAEPFQREGESAAEYYRRLPRYRSGEPAQFAIELRHGTAPRLGIESGQRVIDDPAELVARVR